MSSDISDSFSDMNNIKNYTDILWDFNGTILDDVDAGIKSVNTLLRRRGMKTLDSREDYYKVFGFPIIEYYTRLGFDFEKEDYKTKIAPEWVEEYIKNSKYSTLKQGVKELLEYFRAQGLKQTVISASESVMLDSQLRELGVREYFDEIYGLDNIHASGKNPLGILWRQSNPNAKALFLGDTEHDAEVADIIGADCILIEGGHSSPERLKQNGYITVKDPLEIITKIK